MKRNPTRLLARCFSLLLPFLLLAVPAAARAACELSIEPVRDQIVLHHNPLEGGAVRETIEVRIANRGDTACEGALTTSLRGEQFGLWAETGAQSIAYQLVDERSRNDITPRTGTDLSFAGGRMIRLAPGERQLELVSFYAAPDDTISQGRYTQLVDFSLRDREGTTLGSRAITLGVEIVPSASIGIKGQVSRARGAVVVDLGELEAGSKDLPLTLYVVSTGGYRVGVTSENLGRLKHESASWFVPYQLKMGRHRLQLSAPDGFEVPSRRARFDDYPLAITIGETDGKRAGNYRDTVTFTIAAI